MNSIRPGTPARSRDVRWRALALISCVTLLALSMGAGTALADDGRHQGNAESTFTKWVTSYPAMAGVVGGDVGPGIYAGEILKYTPGTTTVIEALYHFTGSRHAFTALVHVEQTGLRAVISGVVTDGWLKGHQVHGRYQQIACSEAPDGTCYQGMLDILRGSRAGHQ
jgi:hypothetical protein